VVENFNPKVSMPQKTKSKKPVRPPQHQERQPGRESKMTPSPQVIKPGYRGSGKLEGKVALITGGDSGIGRAVAVAFAAEGADVASVYLEEEKDAEDARTMIRERGRRAIMLAADVSRKTECERVVRETVEQLGGLDVVVNNAAVQFPQDSILEIDEAQLDRTFRTNIYAMFFMVQAALPYLRKGSSIINTTSVTAYRGSPQLLDYSSTKGAIVTFTRSLAHSLVEKGIRVNGVAPGPIWTPLIPATFPPEKVEKFGSDVPLGRAGEPSEVAPCYVFLASDDASYITGQILHPNGGEIVNG
jgi:NAD(P)-dependent dehydrogenase (short-subunit alcohol dehydrogenase family)